MPRGSTPKEALGRGLEVGIQTLVTHIDRDGRSQPPERHRKGVEVTQRWSSNYSCLKQERDHQMALLSRSILKYGKDVVDDKKLGFKYVTSTENIFKTVNKNTVEPLQVPLLRF